MAKAGRDSGEALRLGAPVDLALWFVESHFAGAIGLDDIAAAGGLSRSEMSRAFHRRAGVPLSAYLRGRRLSEGAKAMAGGAPFKPSCRFASSRRISMGFSFPSASKCQ